MTSSCNLGPSQGSENELSPGILKMIQWFSARIHGGAKSKRHQTCLAFQLSRYVKGQYDICIFWDVFSSPYFSQMITAILCNLQCFISDLERWIFQHWRRRSVKWGRSTMDMVVKQNARPVVTLFHTESIKLHSHSATALDLQLQSPSFPKMEKLCRGRGCHEIELASPKWRLWIAYQLKDQSVPDWLGWPWYCNAACWHSIPSGRTTWPWNSVRVLWPCWRTHLPWLTNPPFWLTNLALTHLR